MNTAKPYWELEPAEIAAVVNTNMLGVMYGTHVAFQGMLAQGHGQIYNLEGMGSNDNMRPGIYRLRNNEACSQVFYRISCQGIPRNTGADRHPWARYC